MFNLLSGTFEYLDYVSRLPNFNQTEILREIYKTLSILDRSVDRAREEAGCFQVFDTFGTTLFFGEQAGKAMEQQINLEIERENLPYKTTIRRMHLNGIPTQTFEVHILLSRQSENCLEFFEESFAERQ